MYNKDMKQTQREDTPKNLILQALKRRLIPLAIIIILSIVFWLLGYIIFGKIIKD